jgi:hypothetical protein
MRRSFVSAFGSILQPGLAGVHVGRRSMQQVSPDWMAEQDTQLPLFSCPRFTKHCAVRPRFIITIASELSRPLAVGSLVAHPHVPGLVLRLSGGGIDPSVGTGGCGKLMAMFSVACLGGSSMGGIMSLAEEVNNFVKPMAGDAPITVALLRLRKPVVGLPSVLIRRRTPVSAALYITGGDDITRVLASPARLGHHCCTAPFCGHGPASAAKSTSGSEPGTGIRSRCVGCLLWIHWRRAHATSGRYHGAQWK